VRVSDTHYIVTGPDYKYSTGWLASQLAPDVEWGTRVVPGSGFIMDVIALP
jgi:hypothetical protein